MIDCSIARDLLALYAEELCEAQTRQALEAHLAECEDCQARLLRYRTELSAGITAEQVENRAENLEQVKPMKKVRGRLRRSKIGVAVLLTLLIGILGGGGFLLHGDLTRSHWGFATIYDNIKIRHLVNEMLDGDFQPLADAMDLSEEQCLLLWRESEPQEGGWFQQGRTFVAQQATKQWEENYGGRAYDYRVDTSFGGKDEYVVYSVLLFEKGADTAEDANAVTSIDFYMQSAGEYLVSDGLTGGGSPIFGAVPTRSVFDSFLQRYIQQIYRSIGSGERIIASDDVIDGKGEIPENTERFGAFTMFMHSGDENADTAQRRKQMAAVYRSGWYAKNIFATPACYDAEHGRWCFTLLMQFENQATGSIVSVQQTGDGGASFVNLDADEAVLSGAVDEMPTDIQAQLRAFFQ